MAGAHGGRLSRIPLGNLDGKSKKKIACWRVGGMFNGTAAAAAGPSSAGPGPRGCRPPASAAGEPCAAASSAAGEPSAGEPWPCRPCRRRPAGASWPGPAGERDRQSGTGRTAQNSKQTSMRRKKQNNTHTPSHTAQGHPKSRVHTFRALSIRAPEFVPESERTHDAPLRRHVTA